MRGCLAAPQRINNMFSEKEETTKINLHISSDYLGVIRKLEKKSKVASMSNKLYPIIRECLALKLNRLSSHNFTKIDMHKDDIKSFDQLSLLGQLNVKYDLR